MFFLEICMDLSGSHGMPVQSFAGICSSVDDLWSESGLRWY